MLHGYLSKKESFLWQIKFFLRYYRVIAPDMTGFGENKGMSYPYSLCDYADEIIRLVDGLKIKKYDVLAHSFGARVAVKIANGDERADRIVFTGAAGLKPRRGLKYLFKRASFLLLKRLVPREKLAKFYSSDYRSLSPVMKESFKKIVAENLDDEVKRIQNKCLVISGKADRETPPESQRKYARYIKNSERVFIKGAGHFCFSEKPDEFNGAVFAFLSGG